MNADERRASNARPWTQRPALPQSKPSVKAVAQFAAQIPMGRWGEPEEIAAVVAFLASDEGHYITGQISPSMASGGYKL